MTLSHAKFPSYSQLHKQQINDILKRKGGGGGTLQDNYAGIQSQASIVSRYSFSSCPDSTLKRCIVMIRGILFQKTAAAYLTLTLP